MMEKVYKYPLIFTGDRQFVELPEGAVILHFGMQRGQPMIWAKVDPSVRPGIEYETRKFILRGTGHPIEDPKLRYIGTTQDGDFVWHLFEVLEGKIPV